MSGTQRTHAWRIPDADIRTDFQRVHKPGVEKDFEAYRVTHLPSGKSVTVDRWHGGLKNYVEARTTLESLILDGVLPVVES